MDTTTPTIGSVLRTKIVGMIDDYSLRQIASAVLLAFTAGLVSALVIDLDWTAGLALRIAGWHRGALPKVLAVYALVFKGRSSYVSVVDRIASLVGAGESTEGETIEAIPTAELIDHLFTAKTFKRDEVEAKFQVPRYRVTELTKHLKRVGILAAGENNMSILNDAFSRQDVASILARTSAAKDLEPLFRPRDRHFTSEPSAKEIADRTPLSPAPRFASRHLAMAA